MFKGRKLLIATKHGKEKVLAPLLESSLGVTCIVPGDFDTDVFGTFTGEHERIFDPVATARMKCVMAMNKYGVDLVIASEGSFAPHPSIFFINADEEILMLRDKVNDLEICIKELNTATNFNGEDVYTFEQLKEFAAKVNFPSHALILRADRTHVKNIHKGIKDWTTLKDLFYDTLETHGKVYIETDMRAMNNPTRMKVIEKAAHKLIQRILSECPQCNTPGYGIVDVVKGLPCSQCHMPTQGIKAYKYACAKCGHSEINSEAVTSKMQDPMYCDFCNP